MKPGLQLRLNQQLALTPQLQQAIRLLQLSQLELHTELQQLTEANPMLDLEEFQDDVEDSAEEPEIESLDSLDDLEFDGPSSYSQSSEERPEHEDAAVEGLREHLMWQLNLSGFDERESAIATAIIDALDDDGYLRIEMDGIFAALPGKSGIGAEAVEAVRRRVQLFDPPGVASLDLGDCLTAQLHLLDADTPGRDLACRIVEEQLELLARHDVSKLSRKLHENVESVEEAIGLIRTLDPRPGAGYDAAPVEYVTPDVYAHRDGGHWRVALSANSQPRLSINQHYCSLIAKARREDASYMRGQLQEARWLLKSLRARAETMLKVAEAIVRAQSAFLDYGPEAMRPLVLREVAEEVGMHESTISRVTTRKYLHTPRGIFEFKYFFSSSISTEDGGSASATAIQAMIRKLIVEENSRRPLSDQALSKALNERGIQVARRTVAKYREAMRIPTSNERARGE